MDRFSVAVPQGPSLVSLVSELLLMAWEEYLDTPC